MCDRNDEHTLKSGRRCHGVRVRIPDIWDDHRRVDSEPCQTARTIQNRPGHWARSGSPQKHVADAYCASTVVVRHRDA